MSSVATSCLPACNALGFTIQQSGCDEGNTHTCQRENTLWFRLVSVVLPCWPMFSFCFCVTLTSCKSLQNYVVNRLKGYASHWADSVVVWAPLAVIGNAQCIILDFCMWLPVIINYISAAKFLALELKGYSRSSSVAGAVRSIVFNTSMLLKISINNERWYNWGCCHTNI